MKSSGKNGEINRSYYYTNEGKEKKHGANERWRARTYIM